MTTSTVMRSVDSWMSARVGQCFCDRCIAAATGLEQKIVSRSIIATKFSRYRGRCEKCGVVRTVTVSHRLVWA